MLDVRSANLMDLAAALPREADRTDMRHQWISRVLGNELIDPDAVMEPFAREVLAHPSADGGPVVLIMRDGSGNLNVRDEWSFCLTAARMAAEQERR